MKKLTTLAAAAALLLSAGASGKEYNSPMLDANAKPFLIVLVLLFALSILGWHAMDTRPSSMDETRHMKLAMDYRAAIFQAIPLTDEWSHVYPPLYHLSIIPALSLASVPARFAYARSRSPSKRPASFSGVLAVDA